jgi:hypothetical protein
LKEDRLCRNPVFLQDHYPAFIRCFGNPAGPANTTEFEQICRDEGQLHKGSCIMKSRLLALLSATALTVAAATPLTISVALKVPDAAWRVSIQEVREVAGEYWVLAQLERSPRAAGIQVISTVRDELTVQEASKPVKVFIAGKTWKWKNDEEMTFVKDRSEIPAGFGQGRVVYEKPLPTKR